MSSQAQVTANRANARKSTGPRSEKGKAKVAQNAVSHGLFSRRIIQLGDDPKEFDALHDAFYARFKPADSIEAIFVDRMILASWKMARLQRAEAIDVELWAEDLARVEKRMEPAERKCHDIDIAGNVISSNFQRHERFSRHQFALERSMDKSLSELRKLQKERRENPDVFAPEDGAAARDADAASDSDSVPTTAAERTNPIPGSRGKNEGFKPNPGRWHGFSTREDDENHGSQSRATNAIPREEKNEEFKPNSNPAEAPQSSAIEEQEMKTD